MGTSGLCWYQGSSSSQSSGEGEVSTVGPFVDAIITVNIKKMQASLVAQWLGICLPVQGTRVRALVREDPTCRGANGPMSHNY